MKFRIVVAALVVAVAAVVLGIYDHQRIQHIINRDRNRAASHAVSRLHQEENKQQSRDILFGVIAGLGVLIALGAAGRARSR